MESESVLFCPPLVFEKKRRCERKRIGYAAASNQIHSGACCCYTYIILWLFSFCKTAFTNRFRVFRAGWIVAVCLAKCFWFIYRSPSNGSGPHILGPCKNDNDTVDRKTGSMWSKKNLREYNKYKNTRMNSSKCMATVDYFGVSPDFLAAAAPCFRIFGAIFLCVPFFIYIFFLFTSSSFGRWILREFYYAVDHTPRPFTL